MTDVNTIVENTDIDASAKGHMLSQFNGKVNLESLLAIFAAELQELESNAIIPLLDDRTLLVATGDQLDAIGETLGVERRGLTDDFYRSLLFLKLFQRNNRGTYQNILDLLEYSFGDDQVIIQKGAGYDLDIAITFCELSQFAAIEEAPVFGFESDAGTLGYSTSGNLDQGKLAGLEATSSDYVNSLLIAGIVESLPAVTALKLLEKGTSVFGFQGNPYAVGYGVEGLPEGGQLSIERFTNRG